jgi:DNA-3-methyladenine glycosylase
VRLPRAFFDRDTVQVARELLGTVLVHLLEDGTRLSGRITETEGYLPGDQASHGYRGRTARNAPMFMQAGTAYVYFIYGMHFCFNAVTEGKGVPAAVLIRAVQPTEGVEVMRQKRMRRYNPEFSKNLGLSDLTNGPGKLCQAFAIDRSLNSVDLCDQESRLFIEPQNLTGLEDLSGLIEATARIGIRGDEAAKTALWRFVLRDQ